MNKVLVGVIAGAVCGAIDGTTAWFTPQVREQILTIVFLSTIKGVIAGIAAGFFARKVQSVPKGIAFGFVVGLLLAFAVAAGPDPKTGEHYWWQIMIPGSILGGVIGWATQVYGRPIARTAAAMLFVLAFVAAPAQAGEPLKAADALAKLKSFEGKWSGHILTPDGPPGEVHYRVSGGGSTVMETLFPGTDYEMVTVYTVDGEELVAQHYCHGNQPTMRLDRNKSKADDMVFSFVKVTGKHHGNHIHDGRIKANGDTMEATWSDTKGEAKKFYLKRAR